MALFSNKKIFQRMSLLYRVVILRREIFSRYIPQWHHQSRLVEHLESNCPEFILSSFGTPPNGTEGTNRELATLCLYLKLTQSFGTVGSWGLAPLVRIRIEIRSIINNDPRPAPLSRVRRLVSRIILISGQRANYDCPAVAAIARQLRS